jgi:dTDP-4-amino-4,6-dideoxygalactose transaminase
MADMKAIMGIAQKNGLIVIEDAAQAIGAEHHNRRAGSIGHYGCFSFFPSKNLGAAGDGGMVVTHNRKSAENLRCLRSHGSNPKYYHKMLGGNFRLDTLQAAIVLAKLPHLDNWTAARQRNAEQYNKLFKDSGLTVADTSQYAQKDHLHNRFFRKDAWTDGGPQLYLPKVVTDRHIFNQYVIRVSSRDLLRAALQEKGVASEVYYPLPMHLQDCFSYLGYAAGSFPESELASKDTLALPIYPDLSKAQAGYVVQCIKDFFST